MNTLHRRLLRLETVNGRPAYVALSDSALDRLVRAELAAWLHNDPDACPPDVQGELQAFLASPCAAPEPPK